MISHSLGQYEYKFSCVSAMARYGLIGFAENSDNAHAGGFAGGLEIESSCTALLPCSIILAGLLISCSGVCKQA